MEYFKKIDPNIYYNMSIYEKIDLLLKNNVFYVDEKDWNEFAESFAWLDYKEVPSHLHCEEIAGNDYLKINRVVLKEISQIVINDLKKVPHPKSLIGIEIKKDYNASLLAAPTTKLQEKTINKFLKTSVKEIKELSEHDPHICFDISENLNKKTLYEIIDNYYNIVLDLDNYEGLIELKKDVIAHVCPPGPNPCIVMYESGVSFLNIHDLLDTIDLLKEELVKLNHKKEDFKKATDSNYSIKNIVTEKNRFPRVFKNAYSCELFLYALSFETAIKPIHLSYYFDIFKSQKMLAKNIKPNQYLQFINSVYGLNEVRIRKNLTNRKYDFFVCELIKREKELKTKTSTIIRD